MYWINNRQRERDAGDTKVLKCVIFLNLLIQGQWGVTAEQEAEEKKRIQEFQDSIPKMRSQLRILTHFYQVPAWAAIRSSCQLFAFATFFKCNLFFPCCLSVLLSEHCPAVPGFAYDQFGRESAFPQLQAGLQWTLQVCLLKLTGGHRSILKGLLSFLLFILCKYQQYLLSSKTM